MSAAAIGLENFNAAAGRALAWWRDGLEASLPAWLVSLVAGDRRIITLAEDGDGRLVARLYSSSSQEPSAVAALEGGAPDSATQFRVISAAARSRPAVLECPTSKMLTQTVRAPAAAVENLTEAVRFGLSIWTPFSPDEVFFHAAVVEKGEDHIRILIRMVPRADLAPFVDRAARAGLEVSAVAFGADAVSVIDADDDATRTRRRADRVDLVLAVSAVALGVGLLTALHVGWARDLEAVQSAVRAEIAHRAKQTRLEAELDQLETRRRSILARRASEPRVSAIVADLAENLPENVDVAQFEWSGARGSLKAKVPPETDLVAALKAASLVSIRREREERDGSQVLALEARK